MNMVDLYIRQMHGEGHLACGLYAADQLGACLRDLLAMLFLLEPPLVWPSWGVLGPPYPA